LSNLKYSSTIFLKGLSKTRKPSVRISGRLCVTKKYNFISDSCRFMKFQEETEMWQEVQALTSSLRSDTAELDAVFLQDMFSHIPLGEC
jgi:hypothetical protein